MAKASRAKCSATTSASPSCRGSRQQLILDLPATIPVTAPEIQLVLDTLGAKLAGVFVDEPDD